MDGEAKVKGEGARSLFLFSKNKIIEDQDVLNRAVWMRSLFVLEWNDDVK
jgi:hypothetical protein